MPYIITTAGRLADGRLHQWDGPRAVATLDEVRTLLGTESQRHGAGRSAAMNYQAEVSNAGCTIGPLPDGAVIEVKRVSWHALDVILANYNTPTTA